MLIINYQDQFQGQGITVAIDEARKDNEEETVNNKNVTPIENVETDFISFNIEDSSKVETDTREEEDKEEEKAMENNSIVKETRIPSDHLEAANYIDSFDVYQPTTLAWL